MPLPVYKVTVHGEAHNQQFTVECHVAGSKAPLVGKEQVAVKLNKRLRKLH